MSEPPVRPDQDPFRSMKETAKLLAGVSRATIYREQERGALAYVQIRGRRFVRQSEIDRYLEAAGKRRAA